MFKKHMKKMKMLDMALVKLGVALFVLFLVGVWPAFGNWVLGVSPWWFFALSLVAAAVVMIRVCKK